MQVVPAALREPANALMTGQRVRCAWFVQVVGLLSFNHARRSRTSVSSGWEVDGCSLACEGSSASGQAFGRGATKKATFGPCCRPIIGGGRGGSFMAKKQCASDWSMSPRHTREWSTVWEASNKSTCAIAVGRESHT